MLIGSCALTSLLLLAIAIADGSPAAVWITTALIGVAVAPQFATMIAYAEEHSPTVADQANGSTEPRAPTIGQQPPVTSITRGEGAGVTRR